MQLKCGSAVDAVVTFTAFRDAVVRDALAKADGAREKQASGELKSPIVEKEIVFKPAPNALFTPPPDPIVVVIERDLVVTRPLGVVGLVEAQLKGVLMHGTETIACSPSRAANGLALDLFGLSGIRHLEFGWGYGQRLDARVAILHRARQLGHGKSQATRPGSGMD
jgi:hypothetical protein